MQQPGRGWVRKAAAVVAAGLPTMMSHGRVDEAAPAKNASDYAGQEQAPAGRRWIMFIAARH